MHCLKHYRLFANNLARSLSISNTQFYNLNRFACSVDLNSNSFRNYQSDSFSGVKRHRDRRQTKPDSSDYDEYADVQTAYSRDTPKPIYEQKKFRNRAPPRSNKKEDGYFAVPNKTHSKHRNITPKPRAAATESSTALSGSQSAPKDANAREINEIELKTALHEFGIEHDQTMSSDQILTYRKCKISDTGNPLTNQGRKIHVSEFSAESSRDGSHRNSTLSLQQQQHAVNQANNNHKNTKNTNKHLLAIADNLPVVSVTQASSALNSSSSSSSPANNSNYTPNGDIKPSPECQSSSAASTSSSNSTMYARQPGLHPSRLPESPPETDSGAGSASSPSSGSDNSPYSPDFNAFGNHLLPNGTVIHPPVAGGQNPLMCNNNNPGVQPQQQNNGGVILGVLDQQNLQQQHANPYDALRPPRTVVQHHPSQDYNQQQQQPLQPSPSAAYSNGQPQHGTMAPAQISPPNSGTSTGQSLPSCSPSPYVIQQSGLNTPGPAPMLDASGLYSTLSDTVNWPLGAQNTTPTRKRMRSENASPRDCGDGSVYDMDGYPTQQAIKFNEFQVEKWHTLMDGNGRELPCLGYHVVADKGFNYSAFDSAFVNQKKNHFQIAVTIEAVDPMPPKFIKLENGVVKAISEFRLNFYGAKSEMSTSRVVIKQSQTDRKPVEYDPVRLELQPSRMTKVTVARLHFSETTMNNQRKNGRPNPDQKFFNLAVSFDALTVDGEVYTVISYASEKVIVRASNPGQFDNGDLDAHWQKAPGGTSIYHPGPVCVATERAHGALTVGGDIAYTGNLYHPSDRRLKEDIQSYDGLDALSRMSQIRIVTYKIRDDIAEQWDLPESQRHMMGVIAQELEEVLPDAVLTEGEYMQVDDNRIFYESAAAVKELCRLTGNLEYKIDEVEKISNKLKRLAKLKRLGSVRSVATAGQSEVSGFTSSHISCSLSSLGSTTPSTKQTLCNGDELRRPELRYPTGGRHKTHRHCQSCHVQEGLCSNRVVQATIVALVAVMAFCLIAMTTLYILDWHDRSQQALPPIEYVRSSTFSPHTDTGPGPGLLYDQSTPNRLPEWMTPEWPSGSQPPALQPCLGSECETYCCPNRYVYSLPDNVNTPVDNVHIVLAKHDLAQPIGAQFYTAKRRKRSLMASDYQEPAKLSSTGKSPVAEDTSFVEIDLSDVEITMPDFETSIDEQYCWGTSCNQKHTNYTFYIPISRYMPLISLRLNFKLPSNDPRFIKHCAMSDGARFSEMCLVSDVDHSDNSLNKRDLLSAHESEENKKRVEETSAGSFLLPAGFFTRSIYQFRLGYSTELCGSAHDLDVGKSFVQYTFIFYRVCSD